MPLEELINQARTSPFTDEDRLDHLRKQVERQFGVAADSLGTVEIRDGKAVVVFDHNGATHIMSWQRQARGEIYWYIDGAEKGINLGDQGRALQRLMDRLDGVQR
jgi:hypothetical protein